MPPENPFRYGMRGYAAQRAAAAGVHQTSSNLAGASPSTGGRPVRGVAAQRALAPVKVAESATAASIDFTGIEQQYVNVRWTNRPENSEVAVQWAEPELVPIADMPAVSVDDLLVKPVKRTRGTLKPCPNCGVEYRRLDLHLVRCKAE